MKITLLATLALSFALSPLTYADSPIIVKTANEACRNSLVQEAVRAQNTLGDGVAYTFVALDVSGLPDGWVSVDLQSWLPVSGYEGDIVQINVKYAGDLKPACRAMVGSAEPISIYF